MLASQKKSIIVGIVSSLLFGICHIANPEVTSQGGVEIALAYLTYVIVGFLLYFADLYFGNLLPGIIIHWVNNFLLFTVISSDVSAVSVPTLLIDGTPHTALYMIISNVVIYIPLYVYILIDFLRKRKIAKSN